MKPDLLRADTRDLLDGFLAEYGKFQTIDESHARSLIKQTIRFFNTNGKSKVDLLDIQDAENKWYSALGRGSVDYSVYDQDYYFTDLWACWVKFSRRYLKDIEKAGSLDGVASVKSLFAGVRGVLDVGCGIGYTSATLKQMFPQATVYATNLEETRQWGFCQKMSQEYDFKLINSVAKVATPVELVFASEYFEHIERPIEHLKEICATLNPRYFIVANAFNTRSLGHFIDYKDGERIVNQSEASKCFNSSLEEMGYQKIKTRLWNKRPNIFVKNASLSLFDYEA